ncbi:MAG: DUF1565 domain-containing protein, partial [Candidatus Coatesbacteria bacterium]|nr:DUF1565 domain-containing protein [Candidatus Coatesbacteria bacterium]
MVKNRTSAFALLIALTAFIVSAAVGAEFYVDAQNGDDNNTGAAWGDAFSTIGNAMASCTGSSSDVIHVAAATYHESINFKSNTVLLGGYPAGGGARHPEIHQTIIDGSGHQSILAFVAAENCTVDGFTLQNGSASSGGAIYC